MIEPIEGMPDNVIAFEAKGEVTDDDYKSVLIPAVDEALAEHDKVRLLYVLGGEFEGYTAGAMWDDARIGLEHPRSWERIGVVTDTDWVRRSVNVFRWMIPAEVRVFGNSELEQAKAWIAS